MSMDMSIILIQGFRTLTCPCPMPYCLYNVMFILLQCLAVQPDRDKRYSTAADFIHQDL